MDQIKITTRKVPAPRAFIPRPMKPCTHCAMLTRNTDGFCTWECRRAYVAAKPRPVRSMSREQALKLQEELGW